MTQKDTPEIEYVDNTYYLLLTEHELWELVTEAIGGQQRTWAIIYDDAEAASAAITARAEEPRIEYRVLDRSLNMQDLLSTLAYCYVCGEVIGPGDQLSMDVDEPCHIDCEVEQ